MRRVPGIEVYLDVAVDDSGEWKYVGEYEESVHVGLVPGLTGPRVKGAAVQVGLTQVQI